METSTHAGEKEWSMYPQGAKGFSFELGKGNKFSFTGTLKQQPGQRVLIGLQDFQRDEVVEGMYWSKMGFWFTYVEPDPVSNEFRHSILIPCAMENRRCRAFVALWSGEGDYEIAIDAVHFPSVFIVGSCVSRDCFANEGAPNIERYVARSSFVSSMSEFPSGFEDADTSANESAFQRRMVQFDLERALPKLAIEENSALVLVDFIDERFNLARKKNFGPVTISPEFKKCDIDVGDAEIISTLSDKYYLDFALAWARFVRLIPAQKILINKVYWAERDDKGRELPGGDAIKINNAKLDKLYKIVEGISPEVRWTKVDRSIMVAATEHKWGVSPFHYVREFELALLDEIENFLEMRGIRNRTTC